MKTVGKKLMNRKPNPVPINQLYWQKEIVEIFAPEGFTFLGKRSLNDKTPRRNQPTYTKEYGYNPKIMNQFIVKKLFSM